MDSLGVRYMVFWWGSLDWGGLVFCVFVEKVFLGFENKGENVYGK